jgi:hypothetical protein
MQKAYPNVLQPKHAHRRRYNGAILPEQLAWFAKQLAAADAAGERVVVMTHVPMAPGGANPLCMLWNYEEVLHILDEHACVRLVLSGHDHAGGYVERNGVHHLTFPSPLNATDETENLVGLLDLEHFGRGSGLARDMPLQAHLPFLLCVSTCRWLGVGRSAFDFTLT